MRIDAISQLLEEEHPVRFLILIEQQESLHGRNSRETRTIRKIA